MRKALIIFLVILFALPLITVEAQTSKSSGRVIYRPDRTSVWDLSQTKEMTKEEEDKALKAVPDELKQDLAEIKKLDKNKYFQILRQYTYGAQLWTTVYEGGNEMLDNLAKQKQLEVETELLALKYRNADQNSKAQYKKELTDRLSDLFEINESQKAEEVKQLEKRLQDLKESLQARKQNKQIIIERRIQELLGDSRYLKWE